MSALRCSILTMLLACATGTADEPKNASALKADKCAARAVAILKLMQREDGSWERRAEPEDLPPHLEKPPRGLASALAVLALLESGVPADDPAVDKGLVFLREIDLLNTQLVGVQTLALCRAGQKRDQKLIQRNADWLLAAAVRLNKVLQGWGPTNDPTGKTDNWNTQYAVAALHVAKQTGAKIDDQWWKDIRGYYLQAQSKDGSWGYSSERRRAEEMTTIAGICGLLITDENLGGGTEASKLAVQRGLVRLEKGFDERRLSATARLGYRGQVLVARLVAHVDDWLDGRNLDPFRAEFAALVKAQNPDGSFTFAIEKDPALATSYALLFLAAGK